jgi:hypothetical protein
MKELIAAPSVQIRCRLTAFRAGSSDPYIPHSRTPIRRHIDLIDRYEIVEQQDGCFAVAIVMTDRTKVVPGFPTLEQAQEWIDRRGRERAND